MRWQDWLMAPFVLFGMVTMAVIIVLGIARLAGKL